MSDVAAVDTRTAAHVVKHTDPTSPWNDMTVTAMKLVRRDEPLTADTKLMIRATVYFDVNVAEWLGSEDTVTVAGIAREIGRSNWNQLHGEAGDDEIFDYFTRQHNLLCGDVDFVTEVPFADYSGCRPTEEVAFESRHQYQRRQDGHRADRSVEYVLPVSVTS